VTEAASERIRAAMAGGLEAAAEFVHDDWVTPFVIHGSRTECRSEIANLVDRYGIDEFLLPVLDLHDAVEALRVAAAVLA
jgi:hypothetical protein